MGLRPSVCECLGVSRKLEVLIVEDENSVARFLYQAMEEAGYGPTACGDGAVALEIAKVKSFDFILLDLMLPGLDGLELCRELRSLGHTTPIMMITAKDTVQDKILGLDAGGDDYIVKPFELQELLARIRALLRRVEGQQAPRPSELLKVGDLKLDLASLEVHLGENLVSLSTTEFTLLEHLMRNAGKVLSREELLEHVWQYDFNGDSNVLHVYISYLRGKLESGGRPKLIHTVRGVGYRLREPD